MGNPDKQNSGATEADTKQISPGFTMEELRNLQALPKKGTNPLEVPPPSPVALDTRDEIEKLDANMRPKLLGNIKQKMEALKSMATRLQGLQEIINNTEVRTTNSGKVDSEDIASLGFTKKDKLGKDQARIDTMLTAILNPKDGYLVVLGEKLKTLEQGNLDEDGFHKFQKECSEILLSFRLFPDDLGVLEGKYKVSPLVRQTQDNPYGLAALAQSPQVIPSSVQKKEVPPVKTNSPSNSDQTAHPTAPTIKETPPPKSDEPDPAAPSPRLSPKSSISPDLQREASAKAVTERKNQMRLEGESAELIVNINRIIKKAQATEEKLGKLASRLAPFSFVTSKSDYKDMLERVIYLREYLANEQKVLQITLNTLSPKGKKETTLLEKERFDALKQEYFTTITALNSISKETDAFAEQIGLQ